MSPSVTAGRNAWAMNGSFQMDAEQLGERRQVGAVAADAENAFARLAVQRLDHDFAVACMEIPDFRQISADHGRRHELGEIEHEQLFRSIAHRAGIVDHQRIIGDAFQQVSRGDVADVERRILPHQDDIDVGRQVENLEVADAEMITFDLLHGDRPGARADAAILVAQVVRPGSERGDGRASARQASAQR